MAAPSQDQIKSFGKEIEPFERNPTKKVSDPKLPYQYHCIKTKESGIGDEIYDAVNNGQPDKPIELRCIVDDDAENIQKYLFENRKKYCYLWVLDNNGIKILWEGTDNELDPENKEVKHTNITGGGKAYHGGEFFFTKEKKIYVNNQSDRYGNSSDNEWKAALEYIEEVYEGYTIIDIK